MILKNEKKKGDGGKLGRGEKRGGAAVQKERKQGFRAPPPAQSEKKKQIPRPPSAASE